MLCASARDEAQAKVYPRAAFKLDPQLHG